MCFLRFSKRTFRFITVHTYGVTSNESGAFKVRLRRSAGFLTILLYRPIALQLVQDLGMNSNRSLPALHIYRLEKSGVPSKSYGVLWYT